MHQKWTAIPNCRLKGYRMLEDSKRGSFEKKGALWAIGVGGLIAGTLDLLQASILFGWDIPLSIAGGLLGQQAFHGGVPVYLLGVLLHFFIALSFGLRLVLRHCCRTRDESDCLAALRPSRKRAILASRPDPRVAGAHGRCWPPNLL
jgi:hypothetical protein